MGSKLLSSYYRAFQSLTKEIFSIYRPQCHEDFMESMDFRVSVWGCESPNLNRHLAQGPIQKPNPEKKGDEKTSAADTSRKRTKAATGTLVSPELLLRSLLD